MEQSDYIQAAFTKAGELAAAHVGKNEPHESTLARRCFVDNVPVEDCAQLLCATLTTQAYHALRKVNEILNQPQSWYIWKAESNKGWWRPKSQGYTHNLAEAGKYTGDDVCRILATSTPGHNIPVHELMAKDGEWPAVPR